MAMNTPAKQVHEGCGGEILINALAGGKRISAVCKGCGKWETWDAPPPEPEVQQISLKDALEIFLKERGMKK